jgi:putative transposon-encoded protein
MDNYSAAVFIVKHNATITKEENVTITQNSARVFIANAIHKT